MCSDILAKLAGVRFNPLGLVYYVDSGIIQLSLGDKVLVETDDGPNEGIVVIAPGQMIYSDLRGPTYKVIRKAEEPASEFTPPRA